jgi:cellulose synthase operon protein YhjQ
MTEHSLPDPNGTPEDVASLYSWANLHGGKYRDFSASRAQMREKARQRLELAMAKQQFSEQAEAEAQPAAEADRVEPSAQQSSPSIPPQEPASAPPRSQAAAPPAPLEEAVSRQGTSLPPAGEVEDAGRPAWLMPERVEPLSRPPLAPPVEGTLQGSRDRLVSSWYALRGIFAENAPAPPAETTPAAARIPLLAVFSLAGGVGKTSLAATLSRMLAARGESILLVDTAIYGLLPFFFGARDQRPGLLRTFTPPAASGAAPIQLIALDPQTLGDEAQLETLAAEIEKYASGVNRVVVDLATASSTAVRRIMRFMPLILVPLLPDMCSVVSVGSIDGFFEGLSGSGKPLLPYYLLNQFDASLPLHLDVREVLREQLGDRLLPFTVRHAPAVSEALAEGMTVMDYAPSSAVAEDCSNLVGWVKSLSALASGSVRGVRWSER